MEPGEVLNALLTGRYDEIHSAGSAHFRRKISAREIQETWVRLTRSMGQPKGFSQDVVLHDLGLSCPNGEAHVQIAYRDGEITGLVLRTGPPTARFGE